MEFELGDTVYIDQTATRVIGDVQKRNNPF